MDPTEPPALPSDLSTVPDVAAAAVRLTRALQPIPANHPLLPDSAVKRIGALADQARAPLLKDAARQSAETVAAINDGASLRKIAQNALDTAESAVGVRLINGVEMLATHLVVTELEKSKDVKSQIAAQHQRNITKLRPTLGTSGCIEVGEALKKHGVSGGICAGIGVSPLYPKGAGAITFELSF
ncbi:MAG: hypothetical protein V4735_00845 [Pseudomonadota bacterium]